jgi:hypothetical protein
MVTEKMLNMGKRLLAHALAHYNEEVAAGLNHDPRCVFYPRPKTAPCPEGPDGDRVAAKVIIDVESS